MAASFPENWPQFYTATVDGWKNLLSDDKYKDVIVNALQYLVENKRVKVNAFVIMNNHIHLIWQAMTTVYKITGRR
jgi:putative transposase